MVITPRNWTRPLWTGLIIPLLYLIGVATTCSASPDIELKVLTPQNRTVSAKNIVFVKGIVKHASSVTVENVPTPIDSTGTFRYRFHITTPNAWQTIRIVASSTSANSVTDTLRVYYHPPTVQTATIFTPEDGAVVVTRNLQLIGQVTNGQSIVANGQVYKVGKSGKFVIPYRLQSPGQNLIVIGIKSANQVTATHSIRVIYQPAPAIANSSPKPEWDWIIPFDGTTVAVRDIHVVAAVRNADSVEINGQKVPIKSDGSVDAPFTLSTAPTQTISLVAKSKTGESIIHTVTIQYNPNLSKIPKITLTSPLEVDSTVFARDIEFAGKVTDAESLTIMGIPVAINPDGSFKKRLPLPAPLTRFEISVFAISNTGESVSVNRIVKYRVPIIPELSLSNLAPGMTITGNPYVITGTARQTTTLSINGLPVSIASGNRFEFPYNPEKSGTTIDIIAKSSDGFIASRSIPITFRPIVTPTIWLQRPTEDTLVDATGVTLSGRVSQATSLSINGQAVTFNAKGFFRYYTPISVTHDVTINIPIVAVSSTNTVTKIVRNLAIKLSKMPEIVYLYPSGNVQITDRRFTIAGTFNNVHRATLNGYPLKFSGSQFTIPYELSFPSKYAKLQLTAYSDTGQFISRSIRIILRPETSVAATARTAPQPKLVIPVPPTTVTEKSSLPPGSIGVTTDTKSVMPPPEKLAEAVTPPAPSPPKSSAISTPDAPTPPTVAVVPELIPPPSWNAESASKDPMIWVQSPTDQTVVTQSVVHVEGLTKNLRRLFINAIPIPIQIGGKFVDNIKVPTDSPVLYVKGFGQDGTIIDTTLRLKSQMTDTVAVSGSPKSVGKPVVNSPQPAPTSLTTGSLAITPSQSNGRSLIPSSSQSLNAMVTPNSPAPSGISRENFPADTSERLPQKLARTSGSALVGTEQQSSGNGTTPNLDQYTGGSNRGTSSTPKTEPLLMKSPQPKQAFLPIGNGKSPVIRIISPDNNTLTSQSRIDVRGVVQRAKRVLVNDTPVDISATGAFQTTVSLETVGRHVVNIQAISDDEVTESVRTIFRIPGKPTVVTSIEPDVSAQLSMTNRLSQKISLELFNADIKEALKVLAKKSGLNIVSDKSLSGEVNVSLKNVALRDAIDLVLNSQGLSYRIVDNTILVASRQNLDKPTNLKTMVIKVNNISSDDAAKLLKSHISDGETVQSVDQDNLVVLNIDQKKMPDIEALIKRVDSQKIPQIMLEAQIIETATSALDGLGVAWPRNIGTGVESSLTDSQATVRSTLSVATIVNLLQERGQAKILARPQIKALHNQEASIFIGDRLPYTETTVDSTGKTTDAVKFVDLGITLRVLPNINPSQKEIKIKIEPEVSFVYGWRGKNNDIPWIRTRKVNTSVTVKDGGTIIIGGLFNSSDTNNDSRIPILGDLPIIGNLFGSNRTDRSQSELIITITPKIITSDSDSMTPTSL